MNSGLLTQLEAYYSQIDEAQVPIQPDEVARYLNKVQALPVQSLPIPGTRRGPLVAAATAVAVLLLVGGIAWLSLTNDRPAPPAEPTVRSTTTTVAPEVILPAPTTSVAPPVTTLIPPEDVVMANHDAWNRGDYDGWLATFTEAAGAQQQAENLPQILMNANDRIELTRPCVVADTNAAGESTVRCFATQREDFHGPAGIFENIQQVFVVNGNGMIISLDSFDQCCDAQFAFNREYWRWLLVAHPDIYADIEPADGEALPGWDPCQPCDPDSHDPADMLIAIQYVAEFIAQSSNYPITP